ncbi:hypothetical protein SAMN02746095_02253 [Acidocella aminolytica 101 = DSM 11237]|uniref:Uncharacterized protein n=1 Tax=Acidocella aminolytica 101 = DSM 11237 TaxID=1120923 RepID=A0A0D6PBM4_9PROT|nr:hypothetical protein Aam_016_052 [Acidocella aminolytica 101 = DSM 11237]SHF14551.1 hypothetical protein SAMN02746095_02253 [Acidocella aminolytica 101 = DSM 11237]
MYLFVDPAGLDGHGERFEQRIVGYIDEITFALAILAVLTDQPDGLTRHAFSTHMMNASRQSVADPHPQGGEAGRQASFGAAAPTERAPNCVSRHGLGRHRLAVRDVPQPRNTDCPMQPAGAQRLAE